MKVNETVHTALVVVLWSRIGKQSRGISNRNHRIQDRVERDRLILP